MYASNALSDDIDAWGSAIASTTAGDGPTLVGVMTEPMQYVMVYLREVGRDGSCSRDNPYRGGIAEIRVSPAP